MNIFDHYRQRYEAAKDEEFTLQEFLTTCRQDRSAYANAAERLLMAIGEPVMVDTAQEPRLSRLFSNRVIARYPAFEEFYGMEDAIEQIVSYLKHAAQGLEEKKQILYLLGPVGGGKSSLAERLKSLMQLVPIYVLSANGERSPVNDHPFCLFNPQEDAQILEKEYGIPRRYLGTIMSPWAAKRLHEFGGDITKFRVVKVWPSILQQIAIAKTEPGDENNQDISALVGKVDIRKLEHYAQNDPDAYGYSTVSSAAILSSLVSKGYIFLLIKIIYRAIGFNIYHDTRIIDVLFVFGLMGMVFGSLSAIKENDVRRMIAYSSVAQIGYIYMGFGMGTEAGMTASVFHILSHAATKSLLFIAAIGLTDVSGGSRKFIELTGAAYRNKWAGAAFTVGSLSMVGVPLFSGFISKLLFAQAAVQNHTKMLPALIVLGISTILNAIYFMKTVIRIYTPVGYSAYPSITFAKMRVYAVTLIAFILLNVILGISSQPVVDMIRQGLSMFS